MNTLIKAVAIDGPAGSGKSTVAKAIARKLDFLFLDTGAMYRVVTLEAIRKKVNLQDALTLGKIAKTVKITFLAKTSQVFLNGEDVSLEIRKPDLTAKVKHIASAPSVRQELVSQQQQIGRQQPVVMEGRDITTVVLPEAKWKFYLDASVSCRAQRRWLDLQKQGHPPDLSKLQTEIEIRDQTDFARSVGPLKRTSRQTYIDTSLMSQTEVVDRMMRLIQND